MDHVVYLDAKSNELANIISQKKTMILRGATGRKLPYNRVFVNDTLYFINNNGDGFICAKATVKSVINSEKLSVEASNNLINDNQNKLLFTQDQLKKWSGKRYLVLIEITKVTELTPFNINKQNFGNMDDWLLVEDIQKVVLTNQSQ